MAKKQTRRSISVSRTTYERLKAFCESNNISMSQLVETRVKDFLGRSEIVARAPAPGAMVGSTATPARPMATAVPARHLPSSATPMSPATPASPATAIPARPMEARPASHAASNGGAAPTAHPVHPAPAPSVPMTSAAARFAVEPPPPIIKPRQDTAAPKPAEKRPEQIFTF